VLKLRVLMLLGLCFAAPAKAGLFADDDARKQIQQLEARVQQFEARVRVLEDSSKQQVKSMLDLQSQIEVLNSEIRKLRGQNEEIAHGLQDAEKRQKDFYVDLDTRLRHFESTEATAKEAAEKAAKEPVPASAAPAATMPTDLSDPVPENRAFEAAYGFFKSGNHANAIKAFQDFIKRYPDSVHVPNANFWLGKSQYVMKNYKGSLATYQGLLKDFPDTPKAAEAMFDIADCQKALKNSVAARKTLKQIIAKYPASEAAAKAKKQLAATK
jgi:tol-pal system protein YbgF